MRASERERVTQERERENESESENKGESENGYTAPKDNKNNIQYTAKINNVKTIHL